MQIQELFVKPINRPINGVIKADQRDAESVWQELDEYVATKQVTEYLRKFFDAYLATAQHPNDPTIASRMGVWVSGFFGSGKSHFIKILSYLLSNLQAEQPATGQAKRALDFFQNKLQDPMLLGDMRRAVTGQTDVILFNIDSKADAKNDRDAILQVFLRVFNEMQGLSGDAPHVADMERHLLSKNAFDTFKAAFKASNGNDWAAERDAVDFLRDDVIAGLSQALGMSEASAGKWFDDARERHKVNIEGFAALVNNYLQSKGPQHRVVFLVDEVGQFIGNNTQLMLNLQTITEQLGTQCKGRAWVIVTSQADIDATLGEGNKANGQDFSKIQGRFHTRLLLSSSNTDEVIAHRLLEKTPAARAALEAVWAAKGDIINNQLSFSDHAIAFKRIQSAEDFAAYYPFVPYQFQLLQKVFESIRKVGATGVHLAKGERSMLDAFQTAAVRNGHRGTDALVPLYDFYPAIESFLEPAVKRAIDQASDNPALHKSPGQLDDIQLLRALFLIRYAEAVKGTVDNLATLCLNQIDADKLALKRAISDSLERLERQNLVNRNGELWFFLTNEERSVTQEIKSVDVSSAELSRLVAELVFDEILSGQTKVRHRDTKADYDHNRLLDGAPYRQANHDLTLEVLTPVGSDYELMSEAKCIGRSAEGAGRAILKLANEGRVDLELRTYLQIEKYIGPKNDLATPALRRILMDRKDENRQRRARLLLQLATMMTHGKVYALGQQPQVKGHAPSTLVDELLNYLVTNTYSKLTYIKVRKADPIAEIRAVLTANSVTQNTIAQATTEEGNPLALADMRSYLSLAASQSRVLLSDVVDRFAKAPWGWRPGWETVLLVARLFMAGEIKLVMEGNDLDGPGAIEPLTKEARFRTVSILKKKTNDNATRQKAREIHRGLFAQLPPDEQDALVATFRDNLHTLKAELERARVKAEQKYHPGGPDIAKALHTIHQQLAIRDSYEFIEAVVAQRSDWLDLADDTHDVLSFYKTQVSTWTRLLDTLNTVADNRDALVKNPQAASALAQLEAIRAHPTPYGQVNQIDPLATALDKANETLAATYREKALNAISAKLTEATQALDTAQATPELRNKVLKPLQDLKTQVASLSSIPKIMFLQGRGADLLDEVMDKLAQAEKDKKPPPAHPQPAAKPSPTRTSHPTPAQPPAPQAKPIQVVRVADMGGKTYLESEADVESFVAQLKAELLATVRAGKKARVQ
jgi:hypothetical protein